MASLYKPLKTPSLRHQTTSTYTYTYSKPNMLHSNAHLTNYFDQHLTLIPCHKPFLFGATTASTNSSNISSGTPFYRRKTKNRRVCKRVCGTNSIKAAVVAPTPNIETLTGVKATVTVLPTIGGFLSNLGPDLLLDAMTDLCGKTLQLELLGAELDSSTGFEKKTIKNYAKQSGRNGRVLIYECNFVVPEDYGPIGAVLVENEHRKEMYIQSIYLNGLPNGPVTMTCNSWIASKYDVSDHKRIFFTNKSYLPSQTPNGLKSWRKSELEALRGTGVGQREKYDRIYDYDVYNDLGDLDSNPELKRPILGGGDFPYPRRCRTGRPRSKTDPLYETRTGDVYVPRDEQFSEVKQATFSVKTLDSALQAVVPFLETAFTNPEQGFSLFSEIDDLYNEGVTIPNYQQKGLRTLLPRLIKGFNDFRGDLLQFETPALFLRDKFAWFRDEEFSRQTLAGLNPCCIQLVTEWPLMSKLDPKVYGNPESAITKKIVEREIKGFMTVEEAVEQKRLFMLDYHDLLLPYVHKVREIKGTTLYGSRTLFFLTPEDTLRPLAIELTRPPIDDKPQWRQVFIPTWNATGCWLWRLAKAHVLAHDSGYHQLVSHWLRTHCATEPYIIASNRQLSAMHPIYRLLHPHFRYTMEINALARSSLINAGGIIETAFSPGKYSIELSAVAYDKQWRFDLQALPADLINRGMAVEDPDSPHGLKLIIEDYPYANDGLILWDSIKQWVSDYVNHYYPNPTLITSDQELQAWWTEIRTVGHADKKDEPWWPKLNTPDDLIGILTIIMWVTSGHHSAVNFGQYAYAGYFPNRPTTARLNMPTEDLSKEEFDKFMEKPELELLQCFPSQTQATTVMTVLDVLSNHSEDEEYIGGLIEEAWAEDPVIKAAFETFNGNMKKLEGIVDARNTDWRLKNRCGAGVVPYELLKPFSEPGVTGKGVPNSISI